MIEDIFGGLLEGLFEVAAEFAGEALSWMLEGFVEWGSGGAGRADGGWASGPVERYQFLPDDKDV